MVNFLKAAFNIVALFCISFPSYAHFGSKGPFGGSVSTAITQGNTVYIGTSFGGVYESTDSTLSAWRARPVGLKSGKITALAHTGSYLFAATADSGIYMLGGHVGNDRYWIKKNKGLGTLEVNCLLAIDSITLLAGTNGADGLYLSRDKGDTWAKADGPSMHHYQVTSLVKIGDRVIQGALDGGAWTSTDLGHTWQDYNDENTLHVEGAVTLSYNASTSELMLSNGGGLYMTKVGAAVAPVYSAVKNGLPAGLEIRAITNNGSHWYLATQKGIFVSSSSTLAWQALNVGLPTLNTYTVIPFKDHLLAGTKQYGVFTTSISGGSWSSANTGLNNLSTYASVTTGSDVAVVATESGVFVSKNITASPAIYTALNKGLTDSLHVNSLLFVGENLWAATRNSGVFISRDTGLTWMNYGNEALSFTKLTLQQGRIYAITEAGALFSSAVDIADWRAEQDDLPIGSLVTAVGSYSDKIMVGTATHGLFVKHAFSQQWQPASVGLPSLPTNALTQLGSKIFVGTAGLGVWVSDTTAISWSPTSKIDIAHVSMMGLDPSHIQDLATHEALVYASYKGGLVASKDAGATWIPAGTQFNLPSYALIRNISFTDTKGSVAGRVFVSTDHNSLYSNSLSELKTDVDAIDDVYYTDELLLIPNPSEGDFSISTHHSDITEVSILDLQGKIWAQFKGTPPARISLEAPRGLYLVQVKSNYKIQTQKLVIK